MKNLISTILQWLIIVVFISFLIWILPQAVVIYHLIHRQEVHVMPGYLVIITGLSFAFIFVKVWRVFSHIKPFNCLKCMTGWSCLLLAFTFNTPYWFCYIFIGAFIGAMTDALILKYL